MAILCVVVTSGEPPTYPNITFTSSNTTKQKLITWSQATKKGKSVDMHYIGIRQRTISLSVAEEHSNYYILTL